MPAPHPVEFRRRAMALTREVDQEAAGGIPVDPVAKDLGKSGSRGKSSLGSAGKLDRPGKRRRRFPGVPGREVAGCGVVGVQQGERRGVVFGRSARRGSIRSGGQATNGTRAPYWIPQRIEIVRCGPRFHPCAPFRQCATPRHPAICETRQVAGGNTDDQVAFPGHRERQRPRRSPGFSVVARVCCGLACPQAYSWIAQRHRAGGRFALIVPIALAVLFSMLTA